MKEQLKKLYNLMKGLLLTYDYGFYDDEELRNDVYELDRIISDNINNKVSKDDLRWCNEIWNKYKCDKLEDEINKMVYSGGGLGRLELKRTGIVLYEPTSLGYEIDDFIMKQRSFLNNDGKKDGLDTDWYENGQKKSEITYNDGKVDGLWTEWYENGNKKVEGNWKDGNPNGLFTRWYENGNKEREGTYKDGIKISYKYWDEDGNIIAEK